MTVVQKTLGTQVAVGSSAQRSHHRELWSVVRIEPTISVLPPMVFVQVIGVPSHEPWHPTGHNDGVQHVTDVALVLVVLFVVVGKFYVRVFHQSGAELPLAE